ncbi:NUDIX hydrolase [Streptomyces sp. GZWMJZ-114]|uniref:NUDIX domain-containing protein n=1 Tax=Streptomyces sp. GZWMJZ-114 TaxID=2494734 RepID=UPI001010B503|nr:NUDIX hydrolase [Streptomyces sp. GZWMJZ-114]
MGAQQTRWSAETRCSVAVFREESLLLVRCQEGGEQVWKLPGGHVHASEGLIACGRRELKEETGLTADRLHCAYVMDVEEHQSGRFMVEIVLMPATPVQGEPRECEPGRVPIFVPVSELDGLALKPAETGYLHGMYDLHRRDYTRIPAKGVAGVGRLSR